jgi:MtN3 and saliva related transmembrane protein
MDSITIIGLIAGTLTTISFLPQVVRIWKTHSTRDISLVMYLIFGTGVATWLVYGIIIKQWPVIIANAVTLVLALVIIAFKIIYK